MRHRSRWIDYVLGRGITTQGRIESLGADYTRLGSVPFVRFTYQVAGRTYRSRFCYHARSYEPGQSVTVLYDDRNPKRALLV